MASSKNEKKPCSKCGSQGWVFPCDGCHVSFCVKHATDHRQELEIQLNNIQEESKLLQNIHNQHEQCQEHPLISQINVWEQDSIAKILHVAETARDELRRLLDESNDRKKMIFNEFNHQLQTGRQTEHYTEIELEQWKEQLMNIKKQLETPCNMELISDKNVPPIELIKINTATENPLFSQAIQISEDSNNIECSCDSELDTTQSSTTKVIDECTSDLEQNELSTIRKEESSEIISSLCNILTNRIDRTENNHLVLLQLSSNNQSQLLPILNQLTDHSLKIFDKEEECLNGLQCDGSATIFIDLFDRSLNGQHCFLDTISELGNVRDIYIRGNPSEDDNERADFFRRYSKIKAIFENEERLMVQWAIDAANEFKKIGDMYVKNGDKERGRQCFEQGITLYKRLSIFLNEKRRVR
jgi:hypothetical protein